MSSSSSCPTTGWRFTRCPGWSATRGCVGGVLERFIAEEGVPQADIVILPRTRSRSRTLAGGRLGPGTLTEDSATFGGMSSGVVHLETWRTSLIRLLESRGANALSSAAPRPV